MGKKLYNKFAHNENTAIESYFVTYLDTAFEAHTLGVAEATIEAASSEKLDPCAEIVHHRQRGRFGKRPPHRRVGRRDQQKV